MPTNKISNLPREKWALLRGQKSAYGEKYAISNYGRLAKYTDAIKNASLLKGSLQEGYPIWRYRLNGEHKHALLHKLVAKYFLPKPTASQKIVIHLNFKKTDNHYKNLKCVNQQDATEHQKKSPAVIKARKEALKNGYLSPNSKLTADKVRMIRKLLINGKTLKEISIKYKVSDMQIHRIKTGENWSHIK